MRDGVPDLCFPFCSLFCQLWFSYVTCINQQSELRPLISFMEAPCLNSLSVLSTSDELRYDEEVISFNSVCEHGLVCPPSQLVQTGRLKKSLLPSRWIILSCIRRLLRFCSGFLPVFAQMWAHMWTRTHPHTYTNVFLYNTITKKLPITFIHAHTAVLWGQHIPVVRPGWVRSVPVPTTVPVPPSLPVPVIYQLFTVVKEFITNYFLLYFLSLPKMFLIYLRSNF